MKTIGKAMESQKKQQGNAMIYILIALALFGFLTLALARQNINSDNRNLNRERIELYTNELIEYTASAQQAIDMMILSGSRIYDDAFDPIDQAERNPNFILPTNTNFNTPPHIHKVFHPHGGGLNYIAEPSNAILNVISGTGGWKYQNQINVEWTPSARKDVIITAHQIKRSICEKINSEITGDTTIPVLSGDLDDHFVTGVSDDNFTTAECPDCEGYSALCVSNNAETAYSFYTILIGK